MEVASPPFEAYDGPLPYLFVSYAHADGEMVFAELARLRGLGYRIWYDEGIDPGNEWPEEIAQALARCAQFVVFVSSRSMSSPNVRNEIHFAIARKKRLLAIHLEETALPDGLDMQMGALQAILRHRMSPEAYARKLERTLPGELRDETTPSSPPAVDAGRARAEAGRALGGERYEQARVLLDQVIAAEPGRAGDRLARGQALEELGCYAEAIADYTEALRLDGATADEVHHRRGYCRLQLGDFAAAADDYTRALEREPGDGTVWNNRGHCRIELGDYAVALEDLDRAIQLDTDDAWAWCNRARALVSLGRLDDAIASAGRAIELDPAQHLAWLNRAWAQLKGGDASGAADDYRKVVALAPDAAAGWHGLGRALLALERHAEVEDACDRAIVLAADDAPPWLSHTHTNRGRARLARGAAREALEDFDDAIGLDADNPHARLHRARARRDLGDRAGARRDADVARRLFAVSGDDAHRQVAADLLVELASA